MIEVIIPTYKPGKEFLEALRRICLQELVPDRIHIVNTEKQYFDALLARHSSILQDCPTEIAVSHIQKKEFDHGGTRDRAIRESEADIVILMTQDAVPVSKHLIGNLISPLQKEEAEAAYARQLPKKTADRLEKKTRAFNYSKTSEIKSLDNLKTNGIKTYFLSNVCAAYKRETYLKLGGFTTRTIFNEDMVFAAGLIEAGYKIAYVSDAEVFHSHHYSAFDQLHRNFDLGVSQKDHPEVFQGVPSEGEGIRMVKQLGGEFFREGDFYSLTELGINSAFKYLGYQLGKHYEALPMPLIKALTMNRAYWEK
ncbi:MAG: glycosyltransferase [Lachnospiraceae bacterium]|nr:glycosyltransferase [Lachnospiraceae bacterium]